MTEAARRPHLLLFINTAAPDAPQRQGRRLLLPRCSGPTAPNGGPAALFINAIG